MDSLRHALVQATTSPCLCCATERPGHPTSDPTQCRVTRLPGHYEYRLSVFLDAECTAGWRQDAAPRDPLVPSPTDPLRQADPAAFLRVQVGDTVLIDDPEPFTAEWIGLVIHAEGGAR
ncbi:DUF3104 domain-containing protein [Synechococcus sp. RSCCF101]|nr:DUF3104 domain-containing protein [Synechococcus sp. RSCCF101]